MITDPIADLLTQIRNAQTAGHTSTKTRASTKKANILSVLLDEGYIANFEAVEDSNGKPYFKIYLRYTKEGTPVIKEIKRLSKPGRRLYVGKEDLPMHYGGLGIVVVSTSKGVLTAHNAKQQGLGGELICSLF